MGLKKSYKCCSSYTCKFMHQLIYVLYVALMFSQSGKPKFVSVIQMRNETPKTFCMDKIKRCSKSLCMIYLYFFFFL
ncbi:hypothetical protein XELAEV_18043710mg [Xenopus laevis]|uniref:Uncharacterized protein n=1 Tax=Xenopus laevis TaxID=8355 RepID=A0A974BX73_XENLA|nr:hypothetical protein XELAEV_18043710mg [Xenopus laevis]